MTPPTSIDQAHANLTGFLATATTMPTTNEAATVKKRRISLEAGPSVQLLKAAFKSVVWRSTAKVNSVTRRLARTASWFLNASPQASSQALPPSCTTAITGNKMASKIKGTILNRVGFQRAPFIGSQKPSSGIANHVGSHGQASHPPNSNFLGPNRPQKPHKRQKGFYNRHVKSASLSLYICLQQPLHLLMVS